MNSSVQCDRFERPRSPGNKCRSPLLDALSHKNPGDAVSVTAVDPKGKQHTYKVTLGKFKADSNE
jgi:hypothetical protein